ncbi:MAG TPA: tol-pal system-associated acyl-CoA thioesterase [Gammaproteobacteria bacterium]|nr:tol-pal system-associated acyl-CoA thioesterase [Gammaproteobacteria bacterium]
MEFTWPVRVYYEDTDAGGVVYHTCYLKFMERARTEWLRSLGFEQDELIEKQNIVFAVRSLSINYIKPARFNDQLEVESEIVKINKASILFDQAIHNMNNEKICRAEVRIACVNPASMKPAAIPESILLELDHVN